MRSRLWRAIQTAMQDDASPAAAEVLATTAPLLFTYPAANAAARAAAGDGDDGIWAARPRRPHGCWRSGRTTRDLALRARYAETGARRQ